MDYQTKSKLEELGYEIRRAALRGRYHIMKNGRFFKSMLTMKELETEARRLIYDSNKERNTR